MEDYILIVIMAVYRGKAEKGPHRTLVLGSILPNDHGHNEV